MRASGLSDHTRQLGTLNAITSTEVTTHKRPLLNAIVILLLLSPFQSNGGACIVRVLHGNPFTFVVPGISKHSGFNLDVTFPHL